MRIKEKGPAGKGGRGLRTATAAIAVAMLFAAAAPFFFAGDSDGGDQPLGASSTVHIGTHPVSQIKTIIQDELDNAAYDTVIVANSGSGKTGVDANLSLTIPAGKTLIWKATYTGDVKIILQGAGTFEVAAGAVIVNGSTSDAIDVGGTVNIIVSGGTVETTRADADAIHLNSGSNSITVTGGLIKAVSAGDWGAIYCGSTDSEVTISGGTVESTGDHGPAINGGTVTVSGGTVKATGDESWAIITYADVIVSGGTIMTTGNNSSTIYTGGNLAVTGGSVRATGTDSSAIEVYWSIAIYLKGTVSGGIIFDGSGTAVEVAVLNPPASHDGTNKDIRIVGQEELTWAIENISWDLSGTDPLIVFEGGPTFVWVGSGVPSGGSNMLLYAAIAVVALIVIAALAYFLVLKKK